MTDLLETMKTICETNHFLYSQGQKDARTELARRLQRVPDSQDPYGWAIAVLEVVKAFIE